MDVDAGVDPTHCIRMGVKLGNTCIIEGGEVFLDIHVSYSCFLRGFPI